MASLTVSLTSFGRKRESPTSFPCSVLAAKILQLLDFREKSAAMAAQNNEEKNLRKSIYSIDVSKGPHSLPMRKGTACAVKTEGSSRAVLVTSQKVVQHGGTSTQGNLRSKRFCPKYPDHEERHLVKETFQPRNAERFCFIPLQTNPKHFLKLVSVSKLREAEERLANSRCLSYTFFGNSFTTMTWKFNDEEKSHVLTEVDPKGELVASAYRGSPVVSTEDDDRCVIGVVDCNSGGDLCLMFFTERSLADIEELTAGYTDEAARDVTDSPWIPPESARPSAPLPHEELLNTAPGNNSLQVSFLDIHIRSEGHDDRGVISGTSGTAYIKVNGQDYSPHGRGHNVVIVDAKTGDVLGSKCFDTYYASSAGIGLRDYLNGISGDKIVLVAIQDDGADHVSSAFNALKRLGARDPILRDFRGSFALVGYSQPNKPSWIAQEQQKRYEGPSEIFLRIPLMHHHQPSSLLNVELRSEGCDDPGKTAGCGKASIKVNNQDYSLYKRGFNVAVFTEQGR
ncbi:hypothetical protein ACROYT_G016940 [Oculina patagonica]